MKSKYITQVNIAKMKEPLDSPLMKEFVDFLDPINKLADESPGFVWRLEDEEGKSSANIESPFEDNMILINMSVWKDVESLKNFTYTTVHSYFVRNGRKWFERIKSPHLVLWWVDANEFPTVEEAVMKLKYIEENGSTPKAFNINELFNSEGEKV